MQVATDHLNEQIESANFQWILNLEAREVLSPVKTNKGPKKTAASNVVSSKTHSYKLPLTSRFKRRNLYAL
jgi:hypothetical protein